MSINGKIAPISAATAWCIDEHVGQRHKRSGFDAAVGFDFMHVRISISGWGRVVVIA